MENHRVKKNKYLKNKNPKKEAVSKSNTTKLIYLTNIAFMEMKRFTFRETTMILIEEFK